MLLYGLSSIFPNGAKWNQSRWDTKIEWQNLALCHLSAWHCGHLVPPMGPYSSCPLGIPWDPMACILWAQWAPHGIQCHPGDPIAPIPFAQQAPYGTWCHLWDLVPPLP